jgi:Holliday junction resolvase
VGWYMNTITDVIDRSLPSSGTDVKTGHKVQESTVGASPKCSTKAKQKGGHKNKNKNKRSGTAFEHRCKKYLEAKGYYIKRSWGSLGCYDLFAVKAGSGGCDNASKVLWIQCKHSGKGQPAQRLTISEIDGLLKLYEQTNGRPIAAIGLYRKPIQWFDISYGGYNQKDWMNCGVYI